LAKSNPKPEENESWQEIWRHTYNRREASWALIPLRISIFSSNPAAAARATNLPIEENPGAFVASKEN